MPQENKLSLAQGKAFLGIVAHILIRMCGIDKKERGFACLSKIPSIGVTKVQHDPLGTRSSEEFSADDTTLYQMSVKPGNIAGNCNARR